MRPVARGSDTAPQQRHEPADLRRLLADGLRALPPGDRLATVLRDVEGLSSREAAEALGVSERTFKRRLHRARMALCKHVGNQLTHDPPLGAPSGPGHAHEPEAAHGGT